MKRLLLALTFAACGFAQHRTVPLNQTIEMGDVSAYLCAYQNPLSTGLQVNVSSSGEFSRLVVFATITTADGKTRQYSNMAIWLPGNMPSIAVPTASPILEVLALTIIPVKGDQIHGY